MSIPLTDLEERPTLSGDWHDDDGTVIDELVNPNAVPPRPEDEPTVKLPIPDRKAEPINRLLTATLDLQPGWSPQQILPADPNRKSLNIRCTAANATDYLAVADDSGKLQSRSGSFEVFNGTTWSDNYTGPVWVTSFKSDGTVATGVVTVSVAAVTE